MRRLFRPALITLLAALPLATTIAAENQPWEEVFFRANQAYKEGHFQEAIDGYSQLIESGHETGHLFYNLGNAYFRLNQLGWAILNYERARLLIPRDPDLKFNLRYAGDKTQDAIPESRGLISATFFWLDGLNLDELFWGFAILNLLFWAILLAKLFCGAEWAYYLSLVVVIFWLIAASSFAVKWYQVGTDDRFVIVQKEASVLAGPDIQDTILFNLHAGTIVQQERSEDGWSLVSLPDKKRGWVKKEAVERIDWTERGGHFSDVM